MGIKHGKKLVKKVVDIICDVCGNSCKDHLENFEYGLLEASWGYTSKKDLERHECYMCEDCYDKVFSFIESIGGKVKKT